MLAEKIRAGVNAAILAWARKSTGLSIEDAAAKIGVKPKALQSWEQGEAWPTMIQLRAVAKAYKRPSALFFSTVVPSDVLTVSDYRVLPESLSTESPELSYEIRRAFERREIALDLALHQPSSASNFSLDGALSEAPDALAARIRGFLMVSSGEQMSWAGDEHLALRTWISRVEKLGAMVFQTNRVDISAMRGFSIAERPMPVIVLNGGDSVRGRIFTLMHELAHITLKSGGICDLREGPQIHQIEAFCNRVAGSILVPAGALLSHRVVREQGDLMEWEDSRLRRLANALTVSREVVLRRLLILGRISKEFYQKKREEYSRYVVPKRQSNGGPPPAVMILRSNGIAYTDLVIDAYYSDRITESSLSRYLGGMNLKHFGPLEEALHRSKGGVGV